MDPCLMIVVSSIIGKNDYFNGNTIVLNKDNTRCLPTLNENVLIKNSNKLKISASLIADDLKNYSSKITKNKHNYIVIELPHIKDELNINCYCTNSIDTSNTLL